MAYARGLIDHFGDRLQFAAVHPFGLYGRLPREKLLRFLDAMERRWTSEDGNVQQRPLAEVLPSLLKLLPERPRGRGGVYVQASPHHLTKPTLVRRIFNGLICATCCGTTSCPMGLSGSCGRKAAGTM